MEKLFSWIHISDIHVGHGDRSHGWDQLMVTDVLLQDIDAQVKKEHAPIDAILVTGDIAFSGAGRSPDEYEKAKKWLGDVAAAAGVGRERIFVVPGNHDVNRGADARSRALGVLMDALRRGDEKFGKLDTELADPDNRARLAKRMEAYLAFSAEFAPACLRAPEDAAARLFWVHRMTVPSGLKVRLVGMNTALLSADDQDKGKLQLGKEQLHGVRLDPAIEPGELVIVLSHHPFVDGWLADQKEIDVWVRKYAHVHLSGHVHEADTEAARKGWGDVFVRVVAGTVHGDQGAPAGYGYSFGAVVRDDEGKTKIRISPRKWSAKRAEFILDAENVPDGERHAEHELRLALPARTAARPGSADMPLDYDPDQDDADTEPDDTEPDEDYDTEPASVDKEIKHALIIGEKTIRDLFAIANRFGRVSITIKGDDIKCKAKDLDDAITFVGDHSRVASLSIRSHALSDMAVDIDIGDDFALLMPIAKFKVTMPSAKATAIAGEIESIFKQAKAPYDRRARMPIFLSSVLTLVVFAAAKDALSSPLVSAYLWASVAIVAVPWSMFLAIILIAIGQRRWWPKLKFVIGEDGSVSNDSRQSSQSS